MLFRDSYILFYKDGEGGIRDEESIVLGKHIVLRKFSNTINILMDSPSHSIDETRKST